MGVVRLLVRDVAGAGAGRKVATTPGGNSALDAALREAKDVRPIQNGSVGSGRVRLLINNPCVHAHMHVPRGVATLDYMEMQNRVFITKGHTTLE